eukprot:SAG11_NODE_362_length_10182_cov_9.886641_9_plen_65_part_00
MKNRAVIFNTSPSSYRVPGYRGTCPRAAGHLARHYDSNDYYLETYRGIVAGVEKVLFQYKVQKS